MLNYACWRRTRDLGHYLREVLCYHYRSRTAQLPSTPEDNTDEDFLDPYHVAVMTENLEHVEILWKFLRHKSDLYCYAAERGKCKIVHAIIDRMKDKNPQVITKHIQIFFLFRFSICFFLDF